VVHFRVHVYLKRCFGSWTWKENFEIKVSKRCFQT